MVSARILPERPLLSVRVGLDENRTRGTRGVFALGVRLLLSGMHPWECEDRNYDAFAVIDSDCGTVRQESPKPQSALRWSAKT